MKPIVLAHGFLGFRELFGIEYFHQVKEHVEQEPGIEVFVSQVGPKESVAARSAELAQEIRTNYPGESVHLIAHSMGGLDARYLLAHSPELVASITTVSTPHRGTYLAKMILESRHPETFCADPENRAVLERMILNAPELMKDFAFECFHLGGEAAQDMKGAVEMAWVVIADLKKDDPTTLAKELGGLMTLSDDAVAELSPTGCSLVFPEPQTAPPIPCYSYSGAAQPFKTLASFLLLPYLLLDAAEGPNDGLVSVQSAQWEQHMGTLPADHAGVVGWGQNACVWYDDIIQQLRMLEDAQMF